MDAELRAWTEDHNKAVDDLAMSQQRTNDQLVLITRELANIAMMLAPRTSEGPSPLEQLLAQLVAQSQEGIEHLRNLVQQGKRIEGKLGENDPYHRSEGANGKATRQ